MFSLLRGTNIATYNSTHQANEQCNSTDERDLPYLHRLKRSISQLHRTCVIVNKFIELMSIVVEEVFQAKFALKHKILALHVSKVYNVAQEKKGRMSRSVHT